ncbi:MAG: UTP--glucose-1-phosphate uridylyltransferase, partial [Planctomycetota bacterium]
MNSPDPADGGYDTVSFRLASRQQEHVLRWWPDLTSSRREQLTRQVEGTDLELLRRLCTQAESGEASSLPAPEEIRPAAAVQLADPRQAGREKEHAARRGRQALESGQVAVVLVAGGQGTRLGHDGPKGTFPIGPVSGKSLFQIHAEKVLAINRRCKVPLPLYVMTSPDNHATTREFFADHDFFGLDRDQVVFFQQGMMPALDRQTGKLLMADRHRIATSPNGHGGVVKALADGGHLAGLRRRGVRYIFYYQVDNPLVKVADPAYLGYHIQTAAEMSLKVVRKLYPQ